jgi:hypothetical protein
VEQASYLLVRGRQAGCLPHFLRRRVEQASCLLVSGRQAGCLPHFLRQAGRLRSQKFPLDASGLSQCPSLRAGLSRAALHLAKTRLVFAHLENSEELGIFI